MATKQDAINEIKKFVKICNSDGLPISKVILFGSVLENNNTKDSDIDILLFSDEFSDNVFYNIKKYAKYTKQFFDLDIKAYNTIMYEKGNLLIDEVKKNCLEIQID